MNRNHCQAILTEEEKGKPYAKYFYRALARIPDEIMHALQSGFMQPEDALQFDCLNDLLRPGYHTRETWYCFMPDNRLLNTKFSREILIPGDLPLQMAYHCAQEYNNLAPILPELYHYYGKP